MFLLKRLKNLFFGMFESAVSKGELAQHQGLIQAALRDYREKRIKLKKSLTSMIFQQKKLEQKVELLHGQNRFLEERIEESVKSRRDDLALELIKEKEVMESNITFLLEQKLTLDKEVQDAKSFESELESEIHRAETELRQLGSRIEVLKSRKALQEELQDASLRIDTLKGQNYLEKLRDQALQLEVEVEINRPVQTAKLIHDDKSLDKLKKLKNKYLKTIPNTSTISTVCT